MRLLLCLNGALSKQYASTKKESGSAKGGPVYMITSHPAPGGSTIGSLTVIVPKSNPKLPPPPVKIKSPGSHNTDIRWVSLSGSNGPLVEFITK